MSRMGNDKLSHRSRWQKYMKRGENVFLAMIRPSARHQTRNHAESEATDDEGKRGNKKSATDP